MFKCLALVSTLIQGASTAADIPLVMGRAGKALDNLNVTGEHRRDGVELLKVVDRPG